MMVDLVDARAQFFHDAAKPKGTYCPCCDKFGKVYVRPFNSGMARTLVWLYQNARGFVHLPSTAPKSILTDNQVGKLAFWYMAENEVNEDTKKKRSGVWRITSVGIDFVEGNKTVPSHVVEYNHEVWHYSDDFISIEHALGEPFDYRKLMQAAPSL
jgi:hypothetical protein